jgi:RNA polymerase sigma-70 factor, ECF subfamily
MDATSLERELLLGAQRLDSKALMEIYDQYNSSIYAYCMHLLGVPDAAEECVSETFLRFLQAVNSGRGPQSHLRAYLYRIAHNWIIDYYRRKPTTPLDEFENIQSEEHLTIQSTVDKNMRQARMRAALQQLPDTQRQVIILRFLEGWDDKEIAEAISKSTSAINAIQYRAIENLRKILGVDEEVE